MLQVLLPVALLALGAQATPPGEPQSAPPTCAAPTVPVGQAVGASPVTWITSVSAIADVSLGELPGHHVSVIDVPVDRVDDGGFWIRAGGAGCQMRVIPAEGSLIHVVPGALIDLQGEFRRQRDRAGSIVLYAYIVRPAPRGAPER